MDCRFESQDDRLSFTTIGCEGHGHPLTGRLRRFGRAPSLGVDLESVISGDMLSQARISLGIQRNLDNVAHREAHGTIPATSTITTREALSWVTLEGARMLGQSHRLGSLAQGKQADLVMIRADALNMQPVHDPVSSVVLQASLANIESVTSRHRLARARLKETAMKDFIYVGRAMRVVFGPGSLRHLEREIEALGAKKALVLSTPEQRAGADKVAGMLGERAVGIFDRAVMHVPIETARDARQAARSLGADCAVAIGGGSTIGLGKAIALDSGLPILAIPTTYAGSEMTTIYGLTENGLKKTGRDERVLPRTVIYDPELTLTLPVALSVTSGINAIAHAAEGLYAVNTNPILDLMAQEGIAALGRALPLIAAGAQAPGPRADALYGAWLCGTVLAGVDMALHHKLCHTLGGSFNLGHAETHTIVLPHAFAYNAAAAPGALARIATALGKDDAPQAIFDLARDNGAPVALKDIGMKEADLDRACDLALQNRYPNPRPLERAPLLRLLRDAFEGKRPS